MLALEEGEQDRYERDVAMAAWFLMNLKQHVFEAVGTAIAAKFGDGTARLEPLDFDRLFNSAPNTRRRGQATG